MDFIKKIFGDAGTVPKIRFIIVITQMIVKETIPKNSYVPIIALHMFT